MSGQVWIERSHLFRSRSCTPQSTCRRSHCTPRSQRRGAEAGVGASAADARLAGVPMLHWSPSSQKVPSETGVLTQPLVGSQLSIVHSLPSSQSGSHPSTLHPRCIAHLRYRRCRRKVPLAEEGRLAKPRLGHARRRRAGGAFAVSQTTPCPRGGSHPSAPQKAVPSQRFELSVTSASSSQVQSLTSAMQAEPRHVSVGVQGFPSSHPPRQPDTRTRPLYTPRSRRGCPPQRRR